MRSYSFIRAFLSEYNIICRMMLMPFYPIRPFLHIIRKIYFLMLFPPYLVMTMMETYTVWISPHVPSTLFNTYFTFSTQKQSIFFQQINCFCSNTILSSILLALFHSHIASWRGVHFSHIAPCESSFWWNWKEEIWIHAFRWVAVSW